MTAGAGPLRILVVDDEPAILRFLRAGLGSQGYVVVEAATGQAALDAVRQRRADLVVLDLGLPDIDGLEVIRRIRDGRRHAADHRAVQPRATRRPRWRRSISAPTTT